MKTLIARTIRWTTQLDALQSLVLVCARVYVASVFWTSGHEKLRDWSSTLALFHNEYKVPFLAPDVAAYLGTFGELFFPVLLAFGLFGRFAAAGLLCVNVMAVVSYPQLWGLECPAAINNHVFWGAALVTLVAFGPGKLSLDYVILKRWHLI